MKISGFYQISRAIITFAFTLLTLPPLVSAGDDFARRIVGGNEIQRGSWPWIVALVQADSENAADGQFCGGTLISPWWVITATHCFEESTFPSDVHVVLGAHNLRTDDPSSYRRIEVDEIFLHPAYETGLDETIDGDIALIRLKEPVLDVEPIPLVFDENLIAPGTIAKVAGWGLTQDGGSASDFLQEVSLPIVSHATVNATGAYEVPLLEDMLPAGLAKGGIDSCQGDSGGPLIVPIPGTGKWGLAGIVSFGSDKGCAAPDSYGIYSKIAYYEEIITQWIHPGYSRWAWENETDGFSGDLDGDRFSNFTEFAFGSNPHEITDRPQIDFSVNASNIPMLHFRRARPLAEAAYVVERSDNLKSWVPLANQPTGSHANDNTIITDKVIAPSDTQSFFRVRTSPGVSPDQTDFLAGPVRMKGWLNPQRGFTFAGLPSNEDITMQLIVPSMISTPRLELINASTGQSLAIVTDSEDGTELRHTFRPEKDTQYRVILSANSTSPDSNRVFAFNVPPVEYTEDPGEPDLPMLELGVPMTATLTEDDAFEGFAFHAFGLSGAETGDTIRVTLTATNDNPLFFPMLSIYNQENFDIITFSNEFDSKSVSVTFTLAEGVDYLIEPSNIDENQFGEYTLLAEKL